MKRKDTLFKMETKLAGCLLACILLCGTTLHSQTKVRTYANFQGTYQTTTYVAGVGLPTGTVTSAASAVDTDPTSATTLGIPIAAVGLITVTQFLEFTTAGTNATARTIAANTPVRVKLSIPQSILSLASGIEVGSFSTLNAVAAAPASTTLYTGPANLAGYNATTITPAYSGNALLNVLNGSGQVEVTITPTTTFQGVYVKLSGNGLAVGLSAGIYDAYIMENATPPIACDSRIDNLSGIRSNSLANLLTATGSAGFPERAMDNDPALTTFSTLSAGVQALSGVFETVIFNTTSKIGDSVRIYLQNPSAGLLDATVLAGMTIRPYSLDTARNAIASNSPLLSLRLLSGAGNIYEITAAVNDGPFDRVDIYLGGAVSGLNSLRIYDVSRIIPKPAVVGAPFALKLDTIKAYVGSNINITASPQNATDGVNWYNAANTLINSSPTGASQISLNNVTAANSGIYVAVTTRNGCTETSARDTIHVKVLAAALSPVSGPLPSGNRNSPYSQALSLTGDLDLAPFTYSITAGALPAGLSLSTAGVITGTPTAMGTSNFSVQALDSNSTVAASASYSLAINAALPITLLNFNANKDNSGSNVVLTWNTADAVNFSHFEIQRSSDGIRFNTIGTVAYNGSSYTFTDNAAFKGINHYRLKMVDIDGQFENSIIRSVILGRTSAIEIFPNPVNTIITISTGNQLQGKVTVQVTDLAGRVLKQEQRSATVGSTIAVDASRLLNGIYMLNVITEGGQRIFSGQVLVRH